MDIKTRNRSDLKSYFVKNAIPTEGNFADLIDGMLNQKDDGIVKLPGDPLSIRADPDSALQKVINFYGSTDATPAWTLQLKSSTDNAKVGFCLSDSSGNNRLFIDASTGHVGIGMGAASQKAVLEVRGGDYQLSIANNNPTTDTNKIEWGLTNWTDNKLYVQCWQGDVGKGNILVLDRTDGLKIVSGNLVVEQGGATIKNDLTITSGGLKVNQGTTTIQGGLTITRGGFTVENGAAVAKDGLVVEGTLSIKTDNGTWFFQSDGNLCFTNNRSTTWCINGQNNGFDDVRAGRT